MRCARLIVFVLAAFAAVCSVLAAGLVSGCGQASSLTTTQAVSVRTSVGADTSAPVTGPSITATPATTAGPPVSEAPTISQTVREIVAGMSLEAKAAQVLLVAFDGTVLTSLTERMIGQAAPAGVLLLGRNVQDAEQLRALTASLQKTAAAAGAPGLLVAADEEGGAVTRVRDGVPVVPAARTLSRTSTPIHAQDLARATAAGLKQQGVNMVLAPVADVVADKGSFLYTRSYSDDPQTVAAYVTAVIEGHAAEGMITVVKHFPGHGSAPGDSHTSAPVSAATRGEFAGVHLPPFRAALAAGTGGVMMGHFVAPAYDNSAPASQSGAIIDGLLRGELGFEGVVVSDDLEMAAAAGNSGEIGAATPARLGETAVMAMAAGCDLLITTGTYERQLVIRRAIMEAVISGGLSQRRLDEAVGRILALKHAHSLLVD